MQRNQEEMTEQQLTLEYDGKEERSPGKQNHDGTATTGKQNHDGTATTGKQNHDGTATTGKQNHD